MINLRREKLDLQELESLLLDSRLAIPKISAQGLGYVSIAIWKIGWRWEMLNGLNSFNRSSEKMLIVDANKVRYCLSCVQFAE